MNQDLTTQYIVLILWLQMLFLACSRDQPPSPDVLFELVPAEVSGVTHQPTIHPRDFTGLVSGGGGVAAGDINNDGLTDLAFAGGRGSLSLYLNTGDFRFEDITTKSRVNDIGPENKAQTESLNLVDVNGDGWLDIYVVKSGVQKASGVFTSYGKNLLFINQRNNIFREAAADYNLDIVGLAVGAQFFDYDRDGDLDVYLLHNPEPGNGFSFSYYEGKPIDIVFSDRLFENQDGQRFVEVTEKAGIPRIRNFGLSTSVSDVNNDGWLDIYVTNDLLGPDFLYINNGDKTFTEQMETSFTQTPMSSMGSDFADVDNDGWTDLFVGEMMPVTAHRQKVNLVPFALEIYQRLDQNNHPQYLRNMLFRNYGGKAWRDLAYICGVQATEWSWSSFFFDADLDGWKDLFVVNGNKKDIINMDWLESNFGHDYTAMGSPEAMGQIDQRTAPDVVHPNFIFKNSGDFRFDKMNTAWGVDQAVHSKGATYADLDNDGDWDLIVHNLDTVPFLYRNTVREKGQMHFLKVKLRGNSLNKWSIGSRAAIYYGDNFQMMELAENRGYQSGPEQSILFGLGTELSVDSLVIDWIEGGRDKYYNLRIDTTYIFDRVDSPYIHVAGKSRPQVFQKTQLAGFSGTIEKSNSPEYAIEGLLLNSSSSTGSVLLVSDLTNDNRDDILLSGSTGNSTRMWLQDEDGFFREKDGPWTDTRSSGTRDIVAFDANSDGIVDLYFANGTSGFQGDSLKSEDRFYLNTGNGEFAYAEQWIPSHLTVNTKVVVPGDFDEDGNIDLFLGGYCKVSKNFSAKPSSALLKNRGSHFEDVTSVQAPELQDLGRVTDALWSDPDKDGDLDLVLVGEWMPMTILLQRNGRFSMANSNVSGISGLWQSIEQIDLDMDGDDDYLLGNFGLNIPMRSSDNRPISLVIGDIDNNGISDPVLFHYVGDVHMPFVNRNEFISRFPFMEERFPTFESYARANRSTIFPQAQLADNTSFHAEETRTGYMINDGDLNFSYSPLENEAQLAPVYDWLVTDMDDDGYFEALGGGNLSSFHYEHGAIDGSAGFMVATYPEIEVVPGRKLNYFGLSNVRKFAQIEVNGEDYILIGVENGPVEVFKVSR